MKKIVHDKAKKVDDKKDRKKEKRQKEFERIANMCAERFKQRLNNFEYVDKNGEPIIIDKDKLRTWVAIIETWNNIPSYVKARAGVIKIEEE
jgi:5'-deoxynucleotidase YfbR-like HD superfamily hydrolase